MSLKNMSLCHCVYKTYYRYFVFKNMSLCHCVYKTYYRYFVFRYMSLCLCNVICTLVLIYKVSRY